MKPLIARRLRYAGLLGLLLALVLSGLPPHPPSSASTPPNIVLILTDDQRWDTLWAMPTVQSELVAHGTSFSNAFVVNPLCCPSRASILTGRYSHSTDVYANVPPHGGFTSFQDASTLATWLDRAGYETAMIGKYLNGYPEPYVPPGWDYWSAFSMPNRSGGEYFDYQLTTNGVLFSYGSEEIDYSTDVLAGQAESFVRDATDPFFLWFGPYAPHPPATPAPRHLEAFPDLETYRPPSYDEADVSDKPAWVQALRPWGPEKEARIDGLRAMQLRSLLAVDDAVGRILGALAETGRLSNTLILFTSDNGTHWGEHRVKGKNAPYEESIRVPFVVRFDPLLSEPRSDAHLVTNIDIAPTFAELAGFSPPGIEGKSLVPLLASTETAWRTGFLVEHMNGNGIPGYCEVRAEGYSYVEYDTGEKELYDLALDPYQLDNRAADPSYAPKVNALSRRLRKLCDPPPPTSIAQR